MPASASWAVLLGCALLIGFSRTGLSGAGTIAVVGFAAAMPARASIGAVLPLLVLADVLAILVFRRDADWRVLGRLAPWVLPGLVAGTWYLGRADDRVVRATIGGLVLGGVVLAGLLLWRRRGEAPVETPPRPVLAAAIGLSAGFATMVANAAGPLVTLLFLYAGFPVRRFVGTTAWWFFLVNVAKTPFSAGLGLLDGSAVRMSLALAPAMLLGAWLGTVAIARVQQSTFERGVLVLTGISAVPLLL